MGLIWGMRRGPWWSRWFAALAGDDRVLPTQPAARNAGIPLRLTAAPESFAAFFQQHEQALFGYLRRLTGDEQVAYDLSQDAFVRAWEHFATLRHYDQPRAWLFRVATNLALNHLRHRANHPTETLAIDDERASGDDPAAGMGERDLVRRGLLSLAPRQRAALILREIYGLTCDEVGKALGISRAAAKMLLWRAREEFRAWYLREEGTEL